MNKEQPAKNEIGTSPKLREPDKWIAWGRNVQWKQTTTISN